MSLRANIEHLAAAQGIVAVAVMSDAGPREFRGDDHWEPVLDGALNLLRKTDENTIRLVIGKHTVVLQTEGDETVGVVLPTGHAIAKSLRRMIRRMSRKVRAPLRPTPDMHPAAPSTPPGASPTSSPAQQPGQQQQQQQEQQQEPPPSREPYSPWG
jgi:LmbE family N-acetylglucosaminyl deacetylase